MADFKVDPEQILSVAGNLENWTDNYASCVNRILQVANDLPSGWGGAAQQSYVNQLAGFQDDFQNLYNLFNRYATYLRQSANKYIDAENSIAEAAKGLSTGK